VPIYEYRCSQCGQCFEVIHGASEKGSKIACPKCGASNPQRIMSAFSCGGGKGVESGAGPSCSPRPGSRFS
jgi:putative FmdB family regulatory protein